MDFKLFSILYVIWLIGWFSASVIAFNSADPSFGLSPEKMSHFLTFRSLVEESWQFKADEPLDDRVVLRFLLAMEFDLFDALKAIKGHLMWRKFERIDGILKENWRDMEERYPYEIRVGPFPSMSNNGPVGGGGSLVALHWHLGKWDLKDIVSSDEKTKRFTRYASGKMMEDADRKTLSLAKGDSGENNLKFYVIVDMAGHPSMTGIVNMVGTIAKEWKHATELFLFTNVPQVADFVCRWSFDGKLSCPSEQSVQMGNDMNTVNRDKIEL